MTRCQRKNFNRRKARRDRKYVPYYPDNNPATVLAWDRSICWFRKFLMCEQQVEFSLKVASLGEKTMLECRADRFLLRKLFKRWIEAARISALRREAMRECFVEWAWRPDGILVKRLAAKYKTVAAEPMFRVLQVYI